MIQVKQLLKKYDGGFTLSIDDLNIETGEIFGLVGNNGAGKTTFFRLILDLIKSTNGEIHSKGKNVAKTEDWKEYTGSYLDERFLIGFLRPLEYFEFIGSLYGVNESDIDVFMNKYVDFLGKNVVTNKELLWYQSRGNKTKVGILSALIGSPEIIILDEPFAHLDPSSQIRLKQILKNINEEKKTTLLISSHDLKHVTEVCNRIVVLDNGKIQKDIKTTDETLKELESYFAV